MANKVVEIGRLTKDVELVEKGETKIGRYTIAVDEGYGEKKTTIFIPIVAFGKAGEFANSYFKKGMRVAVFGRLSIKYDKEKDKTYASVIAESQEFADGRKDGEKPKDQGGFSVIEGTTDDEELPFT